MNAHTTLPGDTTEAMTFHEDGVYFGMTDKEYHADPALGSTGIKKLVNNAPDFWWQSHMNPARPKDDDTDAKIFGRQLHQCVLEGADKFKANHAPYHHKGNTKEGKLEINKIKADGKTPVKFDDWTHILSASAFIKRNNTLAKAFENGAAEVSVFWTADGTRFKARFDYLQLKAIVDLKSVSNRFSRDFQKTCNDAIAAYDYTISAEHYCEGRRQMTRLVKQGSVFGDHDPEWLAKVATNPVFAFVFVFWQKEGAPISHGIQLSPKNPNFGYARTMIAKATYNYKRFMAEFGAQSAWVPTTTLKELDETDLPVWYQQRLIEGA